MKRPQKSTWLWVIALVVTAVLSYVIGHAVGTPVNTGMVVTQASPSATETAMAVRHTPTADDFVVSIKILSRHSYSDEDWIDYRPRIKAKDPKTLPDEGTVEVSYKITGGTAPILGTFVIHLGDPPVVEDQLDDTGTAAKRAAVLKIKITNVEYIH
jgi:hypothetical protein